MPLFDTIGAARSARRYDIEARGCRLSVRAFGRPGAPPLVLVHGLGMSSLYLTPTARRLADRFEVWAPDLPGFGGSAPPPRALRIPELADALAAFLAALGVGPVPLLGNSLGCQVLVDLAVRHPDLVGRLVLVGPTIDPAHRSNAQQVGRLMLDGLREAPSLLPLGLYDYLRAGVRRFWQTFQHALDDPVEAKLPLVRQPTLVVRGARDPIVPQRWAEEVARLLPCGRLIVIPGAPHGVNYSAPAALVRAVRPFLSES